MIMNQKKYSISLVAFLMLQLFMEFKVVSGSGGRPALLIGMVQVAIFLLNYKYIVNSMDQFLHARTIRYFALILFFFSIVFFSANFSIMFRASIRSSFLFTAPVALLVILTLLDKNKELTFKLLLKAIIFFGTFISAYGLLIFHFGQFDHKIQYVDIFNIQFTQIVMGVNRSRISSVTSNPNVLGNLLMYSTMANIYIIYINKYISIYTVSIFFQIWALVLTESRASLLGLILMFFAFVYWISASKSKLIIGSIVTATTLGLILIFLDSSLLGRISDGLSGREELWYPLMDSIKQNPLTGIGFGLADRVIIERETHNVYLSMLAEIGIIGFFGFIAFWLTGIINAYRRLQRPFTKPLEKSQVALVFSILIGLTIHQIFETDLGQYDFNTLFWVFLVTYSVNSLNYQESRQMNNEISYDQDSYLLKFPIINNLVKKLQN